MIVYRMLQLPIIHHGAAGATRGSKAFLGGPQPRPQEDAAARLGDQSYF